MKSMKMYVFSERYKKFTWETPVPESRKLTEEDIDRFVESMKGIAMQAVFSKVGCTDASIALQHLATLRPKVIVPALIERYFFCQNGKVKFLPREI